MWLTSNYTHLTPPALSGRLFRHSSGSEDWAISKKILIPIDGGAVSKRDWGQRFEMSCKTLTVWPASLRLDQAAEYCGLCVETFKAKCPTKPIEFTLSSRGHRWLRVRLDEWLSSIDPNTPTSSVRRFGDKINGG